MPKPARAAIVMAFLIAITCALNLRSGPLILAGIAIAALFSAISLLQRKMWGGYGFAFLLVLAVLAMLIYTITGQSSATFLQTLIYLIVYGGLSALFLLAGHTLATAGAKPSSPTPWLLLAALLSLPFLLYRPFTMPSNAMRETILIGDLVLIDRFAPAASAVGDVVALRYPKDPTQTVIRRIVGLPSQRLRIDHGVLYRNGLAVPEPYVSHNDSAASMPELAIPAGKCFVLGDSRDDSLDSRQWGLVDLTDILGKPKYIYDSLAPADSDIKPAPAGSAERSMPVPGPLLRRWDRVFKPL